MDQGKYKSLEEVVSSFLRTQNALPKYDCFGGAGPVQGNRARLTNHTWFVDGDALAQQCGFSFVRRVNDMAAGIFHLPETALQTMLLFVVILTSEAANLVLKILATRGLYICGTPDYLQL